MADESSKSTLSSGRWILMMVIISLVAIVLLGVFFMSSEDSEIDGAKAKVKTDKTNPTTTGKAATDEYVEQLSDYAKKNAKAAESNGDTYVSPIIKGAELKTWEEMNPKTNVLKPSHSTADEQRVVNTNETVDNSNNDEMLKEREKILLTLVATWHSIGHTEEVYDIPGEKTKSEGHDLAVQQTELPIINPLAGLVKVGDSLYSSLNFNINTDHAKSGFITSSVLSGPIKGAEFFGRFSHNKESRWSESISIEYDKLVLSNGDVVNIRAVAIDPKYASPSLSHDIDHHYAYRYGSLFVGSLLKGWDGFAKATAQSGTETTAGIGFGGGSIIRSSPEYSVTERALIGSGEIAKELSSIFRDNYRRPNTIKLFASHMGGRPISIIITDISNTAENQSRELVSKDTNLNVTAGRSKRELHQKNKPLKQKTVRPNIIPPYSSISTELPKLTDFQ